MKAAGSIPAMMRDNVKIVEADNVLLSIGQGMDWGNLLEGTKVELNPNKTVKADPVTFQTGESDIFVGGDALTGPRFAIDAIAVGKEGSISIHRYVQNGQSLTLGRLKRDYRPLNKENLNLAGYDRMPREKAANISSSKQSTETFDDLRGILTEEQIKKETERCLGCGATMVDEYACIGCGSCTTVCKFEAISLVRKYNAEGVDLSEMKPKVIKHMLKRKAKIAVKTPIRKLQKALAGE